MSLSIVQNIVSISPSNRSNVNTFGLLTETLTYIAISQKRMPTLSKSVGHTSKLKTTNRTNTKFLLHYYPQINYAVFLKLIKIAVKIIL